MMTVRPALFPPKTLYTMTSVLMRSDSIPRPLLFLSSLLIASGLLNATPSGTRLLRTPTISADSIAFAYANNIWIVDRKGGTARRLTSFQGQTSNPHLSPDGSTVAFSAEYSGNTDVYVVPASG